VTTLTDFAVLRQREFSRLDATKSVYLDYTGAALYPESLVTKDAHRLTTLVIGNPHSDNSPSIMSMRAIEAARQLTLQFFDADPADYDVVFTANASSAIRILADAFPFRKGSRLVMTADNHNSVNGLRLPARRRHADVAHVPVDDNLRGVDPTPWLPANPLAPSLFAYPAQSNFSGVQHPLSWVATAQERGYYVLLDAAGYAPTSRLSLTDVPADFVAISYYKLFGYPTGVGALIARHNALAQLRRGYFSGGTVQFVSLQNRIMRHKSGSEGFEDGTPNFLAMPAICDGLNWLTEVGMRGIENHITALTDRLLKGFGRMGERIRIYGPRESHARGGTIAFNLYRNGQLLTFEAVEAAARERGIAIRGGCFCNPGAAEKAFGLQAVRARACLQGEFTISRFRACLGGAVGAVRTSVGIATNDSDLDALLEFVSLMTDEADDVLVA
jgi:selenocysteine lyase/cysteine desulfurase